MPRLISLLPLLALMAVSACETMKGAGRDIETAGQFVTKPYNDAYGIDPTGGGAPGQIMIDPQPYDGGPYNAAPYAPAPYPL